MRDAIRGIIPPNGYKESRADNFPVLTSQSEGFPIRLTNRPFSVINSYFGNNLSKSIEVKLEEVGSKKVEILNLGSGTQSLACKEIEEEYGETIRAVGIDFYPKDSRGLNVVQGDARELPFEANSFHIIFSVQMLNYVNHKDDEKIVSEISRILKPKGIALLHWDNFALLDLNQMQRLPLLEYTRSLGIIWKSKVLRYADSIPRLFHAVIKPPVDKRILENINQIADA